MTRKNEIQTNFTAGELSPRLHAHVDLDRYKNGAQTITNFVVLPHGPVDRRRGLKFINEVKTSATAVRLLKFQFSQSAAYIIEFGNTYLRFYKDRGQVTSGGSPYEISSPYATSELFDVTYFQLGARIYLFHGSHPVYVLTWAGDTSWTLAAVSFSPEPTIENGNMPAATLTPAATSGVGVNFTASAASFIAGDIGRQLINLSGTGKAIITAFTSSTVVVCTITEVFPNTSAIASQSWKKDLSPVVTLTPGGVRKGSMPTFTGGIANSWLTADLALRYAVVNNGVARIIASGAANTFDAEIMKTLDSTSASSVWSLEEAAWSSTFGYPKVGVLHQSRLFAASISTRTQGIWASDVGIYNSMGAGSHDSDALDFDVSSKEMSNISWMMPVRGDLAIGTANAELTLSGNLTPSTISGAQQSRTYCGSNLQQPIGLDSEVVYIQRSGRKLNSFRYDFNIDNYQSEDLLFLAEHMSESKIKEICYAQDPDRHIYAVLNNGDLLVCTYVREQSVIAWSRIQTSGTVESVQSISTGEQDEVWVVVNRTINGSTKRYVETFDLQTGDENLYGFSDCYLTYSNGQTVTSITKASQGVVTVTSHGYSNGDSVKIFGGEMTEVIGKTYVVSDVTANTFKLKNSQGDYINTTSFTTYVSGGKAHKLVTTVSGLSHLEGKTVQVKADGAIHTDQTVSSGAITLDRPSYDVVVGLSYESTLKTLKKELNLGEGTQQGQQIRWCRPMLRLLDSAIPMLNDSFVPGRSPQDLMDKKLPLFTGDISYGSMNWTDGAVLEVSTSLPLPCTILGIFGSIEGGSR